MKILLISHNPISSMSNMGKTFRTMFSAFDRSELCQLYIYPSYPDEPYCSSFYRVTDKDVLKKLSPGGEVEVRHIHEGQTLFENAGDESVYRNVKNKSPLRRLARDMIWQRGNWYNKKLKAWLDKENPTCIFLSPGPARFIYSIALKIAKERQIPIVTYICDEYYFVAPEKTLLGKWRLSLLKRKVEQTMKKTSLVVGISKEIETLYSKTFSVPATVLMTGSGRELAEKPQLQDSPQTLAYFGNIRVGRYASLAAIGRALDDINAERGTSYRLHIYTGEKDPLFLEPLDKVASIERHGFLSGEAFVKAMNEAGALVHTEAFDEENIDRVRHSVSTKIADSLACGIPLFAYGPACVSSMSHLIDHDCAITATSEAELKESLCRLFDDRTFCETCVKNALAAAAEWHNTEVNSKRLYDLLQQQK
ncbi:MAG: hypothetical protein IKV35_02135 [Clostridia bacterium]|nr:hypothetical protein [Clostridia bacterium]